MYGCDGVPAGLFGRLPAGTYHRWELGCWVEVFLWSGRNWGHDRFIITNDGDIIMSFWGKYRDSSVNVALLLVIRASLL